MYYNRYFKDFWVSGVRATIAEKGITVMDIVSNFKALPMHESRTLPSLKLFVSRLQILLVHVNISFPALVLCDQVVPSLLNNLRRCEQRFLA